MHMIGAVNDKGGVMRLLAISLALGLFASGIAASTGGSLVVDGKTVTFGPSEKGAPFADFTFNDKGYANAYTLDCEKRQFLWTKNVRLTTGEVTSNTAGAEWRGLSPSSTVSNAVYNAICADLLFDNNDSDAARTFIGMWQYMDEHGRKNFLRVLNDGTGKLRLIEGFEVVHPQGGQSLVWRDQKRKMYEDDVIHMRFSQGTAHTTFSSGVFRATHGLDFIYRLTIGPKGDDKLLYTVWGSMGREGGTTHTYEATRVALDEGGQKNAPVAEAASDTVAGSGAAPPASHIIMKDGSVIVGEVQAATLPFVSSLGEVNVSTATIQKFENGSLTLADGSVLKGQFGAVTISITSSVGPMNASASNIVAIAGEVIPAAPANAVEATQSKRTSGSGRHVAPIAPIQLQPEQLVLPPANTPAPTPNQPPRDLVECIAGGRHVLLNGKDETVLGCVSSCPQGWKPVHDCKTFARKKYPFKCVSGCWPENMTESVKPPKFENLDDFGRMFN